MDESKSKFSLCHHVISGYVYWTVLFRMVATFGFYDFSFVIPDSKTATVFFLFVLLALAFTPIMYHTTLRLFFKSEVGDCYLQVITALGLLSYHCIIPWEQIMFSVVSTYFGSIKFAGDLSRFDHGKKKHAFWGYTIGFFMLQASRIGYMSILPASYSNFTNGLIALFGLANSFYATLPPIDSRPEVDVNDEQPPWEVLSMGFGSMLAVLCAYFDDPAAPVKWALRPGDPMTPLLNPMLGSSLVIFAFVYGIILSWFIDFSLHPFWSFTAIGSLYIMVAEHGILSFLGSLMTAVYLSSMWVHYINVMSQCSVGRILAVSFTIYLVEFKLIIRLFPTFAPETLRYPILICSIFFISSMHLGLAIHRRLPVHTRDTHIAFNKIDSNAAALTEDTISLWLLFIVTLAATNGLLRYRYYNPASTTRTRSSNDTFVLLIMSTGHGVDKHGWPNAMDAELLCETIDPDIIVLLETSPLYGGSDLIAYLSERLNFYTEYGFGPRYPSPGLAILSRYPVVGRNFSFYANGAVVGMFKINIYGNNLTVIAPYLKMDTHKRVDRLLHEQDLFLINYINSWKKPNMPILLAGNFYYKARGDLYYEFLKSTGFADIDHTNMMRYNMYVFFSELNRMAFGHISSGALNTDNIQLARFSFHNNHSRNNTVSTRHISQVPKEFRFNSDIGDFYMFEIESIGQESEHVASTKYFLPPPRVQTSVSAEENLRRLGLSPVVRPDENEGHFAFF